MNTAAVAGASGATQAGPRRWHREVPTPIGTETIVAQDGALVALWMDAQKHLPELSRFGQPEGPGIDAPTHAVLDRTQAQLEEYFAGGRKAFDVPLAPEGTAFQQAVWLLLRDIAFGSTTTYGELAAQLGKPSASRAVGAAVGRNPIGLVVPCHRVIGASGALTGYAGGIERKTWLLRHEGVLEPALL